MGTVDIQVIRKREKRRICRDLKMAGKSKKWLSEQTGFHYNTVCRYLDIKFPGFSEELIKEADRAILEYHNPTVDA